MDGKPVTFTVTEIEGLEQIISAGHKWLDGSNPAYPNLILKLGGAFMEAHKGGQSQELYLSEMEAWYLREIVPTGMRVRGEPVGLAVKKKLYPLLLEFEAEKYSSTAGSRYGFSIIDEPLTRKDALLKSQADEPESDTENADDPPESSESKEVPESQGVTDLQPEDFSPPQDSHSSDETVDSTELNRGPQRPEEQSSD